MAVARPLVHQTFPTLLVALIMAGPAFGQTQSDTVRRVPNPIPGRYIVVLENASDSTAVGNESALTYGGQLEHTFSQAVNGFAIQMSDRAARQLARDPRVMYVEEDGVVHATGVQAGAPWGLDRIDQRTLPRDTTYTYYDTMAPVYVHVIDTGIRPTHVEFGGRATVVGDFVDDDGDGDPFDVGNDDADPLTPDGRDCHGHGTHVAGTIGAATYGVAKTALLLGYRVLDCTGFGSTSGVIAAVDAVATDSRRPAVANMSLGGPPSTALDDAVRRAILMGVTFAVAAGNDGVDASTQSPARVVEALTVGATNSTDARASWSNFGAVLDLFAPGVAIQSTWWTSDTATATLSGTSMASPHVAGVAALYMQRVGTRTPTQVRDALVTGATVGVVVDAGAGSPNRLLYSRLGGMTTPVVTVVRPNGTEKLYSGTPYPITWTASDPDGLDAFDVLVSTDDGRSYAPIVGCTNVAGSLRQCVWAAPGPATTTARIRVVARDAQGDSGSDASDGTFSLYAGTAVVTVTSPNTAVTWPRGSTQTIRWTNNLGPSAHVRVELSRDGGATFPETLAASVRNTSSSSGSLTWQVTGPSTTSGVVRVTWTAAGASDTSNVPFTIAEPFITMSLPTSTVNWGYGTTQAVKWQTNLPSTALVNVLLSLDGGATFPITLASGVAASAKQAVVTAPTLGAATALARVRVIWVNPPGGVDAVATNPAAFTIAPPFLTVTAPNGGETWTVGAATNVRWASNLGSSEYIQIDLSLDGGATFPVVVLPSTRSDGAEGVVVSPAWITPTARVRVTWLRSPAITDTSNASFRIP